MRARNGPSESNLSIQKLCSRLSDAAAAVNSALFVHGPGCQLRKSLSEALAALGLGMVGGKRGVR